MHLGLGVNEGILRFKRKWGGRPYLPYVMAAWEEKPRAARNDTARALTLALLRAVAAPSPSLPSPENARPDQRPFAMLWEVEKNGRVSWLGGTAHFFCYSFETSFIRLFRKVDNVLFEGPLDEDALAAVDQAGKRLSPEHKALLEMLAEEEIRRLERVVRGPEGPLVRWLGMEAARKADVRWAVAPCPALVRLFLSLDRLSGAAGLVWFRGYGGLAHRPQYGQERDRHGKSGRTAGLAGVGARGAGAAFFPGLRRLEGPVPPEHARLSGRGS